MKRKVIIGIATFLLSCVVANAQKFAYINTEYILKNIPAYESAKKQLSEQSTKWEKEVETLYSQIDKLYKDYQAEKVLLTDEMQTRKENEIVAKEKAAKAVQKKYFGREGELYKKRQALVKPIQDEVYTAVQELAKEGSYAVIFDSSGGSGVFMMYNDPKYDKSDAVLKKLGYRE